MPRIRWIGVARDFNWAVTFPFGSGDLAYSVADVELFYAGSELGIDVDDRFNIHHDVNLHSDGVVNDGLFYIFGPGTPSFTVDGPVLNGVTGLLQIFDESLLDAPALTNNGTVLMYGGLSSLSIAGALDNFGYFEFSGDSLSVSTAINNNGGTISLEFGALVSTPSLNNTGYLSVFGPDISASDIAAISNTGTGTIDVFGTWVLSGASNTYSGGGVLNGVLDGGAGNDTFTGGDSADHFAGGLGDDSLNGGGGNDTLAGGGDDDTLLGGAGDDTLSGGEGGLGADVLDGGADTDTISYANDSAVTVSLAITTQQNTGGAGLDTITNVENVIGSINDDTITGSDHANVLLGGEGNDTLNGGGGNDTLDGGAHNDTLSGGSGIDSVTYANGAAVTVSLLITTQQNTGGAGLDTITGVENVTGSGFNDTIAGDGQANVLSGMEGADSIFGDAGVDTLYGGSGADTLDGGLGNDVLRGGGGKDLLTGNGGLDTFVFESLGDSGVAFAFRDAINVFAHGDKIDLSAIDANVNVAGDQAFIWTPGGLTGVAGQLTVLQNAARSWTVLADVNGDGAADFALNIYGSVNLNNGIFAWDFIL